MTEKFDAFLQSNEAFLASTPDDQEHPVSNDTEWALEKILHNKGFYSSRYSLVFKITYHWYPDIIEASLHFQQHRAFPLYGPTFTAPLSFGTASDMRQQLTSILLKQALPESSVQQALPLLAYIEKAQEELSNCVGFGS